MTEYEWFPGAIKSERYHAPEMDLMPILPIAWAPRGDGLSGPSVTDPLTIYLACRKPHDTDMELFCKFSLADMIKDDIEAAAEDGSFSFGLAKYSTALRLLADKIDAAIQAGHENTSPNET